jgi:hypothetical protein
MLTTPSFCLNPKMLKRISSIAIFTSAHTIKSGVILFFVLLISLNAAGQQEEDIFNTKVTLGKQRTTVYQALNQLSDSIGYFFAYDSRVVYSDRRIRTNITKQPLKDVLQSILNDSTLTFQVVDKHILIFRDQELFTQQQNQTKDITSDFISIKGRVFDSGTRQPIAYATVGIPKIALGNITNSDGVFLLRIPKIYSESSISISHIGYKTKHIPINIFQYDLIDIYLNTDYISIQEVIIRNIDPQSLIKEAIEKIPENYSDKPTYLKTFYREGVVKNNKYQNYSEAIFNIYKTSYKKEFDTDQIKLLKSRKTQNINHTDTLSIKLKAGINGSLNLDIAKNLPAFLQEEYFELYNYTRKDIVTIGGRLAYEIAFNQKENIAEPLFNGVIYIDIETLAILGADFEINPLYISRVTDQFVYKRIRNYRIRPEAIKYSVRYSYFENKFHLSHIRADLDFKYRKRRTLFYNPFHLFFEMVVSQIETNNVVKFDKREIETKNAIFFDLKYEYDELFWKDFNIIEPEQIVFDALNLINSKIEEIH